MANPLARVVMNSVAQKSGKVSKHPSRVGATDGRPNLGAKETQLLSSLLNSKGKTTTTSSSYDKNTYGRSSNVASVAANTMKTLDSLTKGASHKTSSSENKKECIVDKSRPHLKSLCSLNNISVGKTAVTSNRDDVTTSKTNNNTSTGSKLDLSQLLKGKSTGSSTNNTVRRDTRSSNKQTSGMTTLGSLAGDKTKNKQPTYETNNRDNSRDGMITTNNSFVKSKTVINNLETYVPKVTLESIGKKGSLF